MTYTARIQQKRTGAWRVISYHRTEHEAAAVATKLLIQGWVATVFAGRHKLAEWQP